MKLFFFNLSSNLMRNDPCHNPYNRSTFINCYYTQGTVHNIYYKQTILPIGFKCLRVLSRQLLFDITKWIAGELDCSTNKRVISFISKQTDTAIRLFLLDWKLYTVTSLSIFVGLFNYFFKQYRFQSLLWHRILKNFRCFYKYHQFQY